ncbi:MAG: YdjY domain-containing protein, partial [Planctomycetota bacterium]
GRDDGPIQSVDAREWVRDLRDGKAMRETWVFAGSGFWKDEETGREYYLAESGDMVCVSNFGTAMLDIPDNSPQSNEGLLFEAFTERIPPLGTPVRLTLTPKPARPAAKPAAIPAAASGVDESEVDAE